MEATPHLVVGGCTITDQLKQPFGILHGGVLAAIAESIAVRPVPQRR
ncbi:MAG: hypothetical protein JOY80_09105 [Candidatus Dormibacteraeota bacterium]|nr:hypothetical protein [Candidatus Dormibacteraeota bacterium]